MAMAQSHPISSEALLRFRYYQFVRKWGKDVLFQVLNCSFLENAQETLLETLTANGATSGRGKRFNRDEIDKITNHPPECLDITAINKILQFLWGKGINDPSDRMKELVKKIKDARNHVCHDEGNISQLDLDNKLQDFGKTLEGALDEALSHYPCHNHTFIQMKLDIADDIPKIKVKIREKYDHTDPDDIERLRDEIEENADQLREYVLEKSVNHLIPIYSNICKILPFDWLCQYGIVDPSTIAVPLRLDSETKFLNNSNSLQNGIINQREILDVRDSQSNVVDALVVSGDAGSGKTTLLCSLIEKWYKNDTHDIPTLDTFPILFHMEFRKHDYDIFDDYLRDLLQPIVTLFGLDLVKSAVFHSKCLILCDGYDERNAKSTRLFQDILNLKYPTVKIITTTRPVNTRELTYDMNHAKKKRLNLTLMGLQTHEMKVLITRLVDHHISDSTMKGDMVENIDLAYQSMTYKMKDILKNPLQFNLFVLLYIECPDSRKRLNTLTNIFFRLDEHKLKRLKKKLNLSGVDALTEFEEFFRAWSLKYYITKKFELKENDVKIFREKCSELGLEFNEVMSAFFNIKHSRKGLDIEKIYCYRHRTEQEYASVFAICILIIKFYNEQRLKFKFIKSSKQNVIDYVFTSTVYGKEILTHFDSNAEKSNAKENTERTPWHRRIASRLHETFSKKKPNLNYLMDLFYDNMTFFTGILFNIDKSLLYLVLRDIVFYFGGQEYSEVALQHLREADKDEQVADVVASLIGNDKELSVMQMANIVCVPIILSKIKPSMLTLSITESLCDQPYVMEAIDAAVQHNIPLALFFEYRDYSSILESGSNNDKYLTRAKTCVEFRGTLSASALRSISTSMKAINLVMAIENIGALADRLPDLTQLQSLELVICDDESASRDNLPSLVFNGRKFTVTFLITYEKSGNVHMEEAARLLNTIWPRGRRQSDKTCLWMFKKMDDYVFSGDEIETLLNSLDIQPTHLVEIAYATLDARERREELRELCLSKGLGKLGL